MLAPEVVDVHRLQEWLAGSVWALIGLNVLALGLFLTALIAPQIRSIRDDLASKWKTLSEWRAARAQARLEAEKLAAAKKAEEKAKAQAEEAARVAEDKARKMSEDGLPTIGVMPPPPPDVPVAPLLPPPPPMEAAPAPAPVLREPFGLDEKTEVLDASEVAALSATKLESLRSSEVSDKTEEIPRPDVTSLPQAEVSAEKVKSTMAAPSFEKSLDELAKESPATNEVSIFDTSAIDDALKDVLDEDSPR